VRGLLLIHGLHPARPRHPPCREALDKVTPLHGEPRRQCRTAQPGKRLSHGCGSRAAARPARRPPSRLKLAVRHAIEEGVPGPSRASKWKGAIAAGKRRGNPTRRPNGSRVAGAAPVARERLFDQPGGWPAALRLPGAGPALRPIATAAPACKRSPPSRRPSRDGLVTCLEGHRFQRARRRPFARRPFAPSRSIPADRRARHDQGRPGGPAPPKRITRTRYRMITLFSILLLGFFLGMRHATDADHVRRG